jgi:DNA-binding transcriptional LysR family regulator
MGVLMGNWEGVNEFVAVAETSSFTQAALRLNTSVANVSRRVASLEDHLAVKLLLRTTRQVSLTEAGGLYYQHCKHLVEGLELAELAVSEMQLVPKGKLKVTAPVTFGEQKIAPLLLEFLQRYPLVELELILTNQQLDIIDQGIDLAIRLGQLNDSTLIAKKLSNRQLFICASPEYLEQNGEPHTLSELGNHHCLIGTYDHWRFADGNHSRMIKVHGRVRCSSGLVLLDAALKGMGLAQLPDYYVYDYLKSGQLVEVLGGYKDQREGVWALYSHHRHLSPKVRLLVDYLTQTLSLANQDG